jgi:acyl-CoA synthetase (AMP-forming)/AMP-acid ligase II
MTSKSEGWRIWAVVPGEWMLRGIYMGRLWMAPMLTAECLDTPRHQPLDPSCTAGVYTFARLEDALLDAVVQKTFDRRWERRFGPTEIVVVLGLVELTGTITEWRKDGFYAFECPGGFPLELRGRAANMQELFVFENWLGESGRDWDRLVQWLARRYAPVHVMANPMPDLAASRELAGRLHEQGLDWENITRAVAADVPPEIVRDLSRAIREQLGDGSC